MHKPSTAHIRRVLPGADEASRLAAAIDAADGLDPAIALASHDQAAGLLASLLALRAALEEDAEPALKAARRRAAARALDHRAERLFAEAAEFFGKAAWRTAQGEADLADSFRRRAQAAETGGEALADRAAAHREEAALCEGRLFRAAALAQVAAA